MGNRKVSRILILHAADLLRTHGSPLATEAEAAA
jgi:hypothetical protein